MPQAVCCYDHMLCCPKGFKCSPDEKTCSSGVLTVPALSALSPMSLKKGFNRLLESPSVGGTKLTVLKTSKMFHSIVCPDGECECQSDHTCCELSSGRWGCCPLPNALCCDDGVHCCPEGSIYFPSAGICLKEIERTPFSIYYGGSCCQPHAGQFYCCDLRDAACCHDGGHSCCPNGYTCIAHGNCIKQSKGVAILERIPASMQKADAGAVLSVQMGNLSVHIHTHVVNFLQVSMAVVLCQMLFAVVMEHFAVLMDTAAMFQLEPASIREKLKWGIMTGYCNFH